MYTYGHLDDSVEVEPQGEVQAKPKFSQPSKCGTRS